MKGCRLGPCCLLAFSVRKSTAVRSQCALLVLGPLLTRGPTVCSTGVVSGSTQIRMRTAGVSEVTAEMLIYVRFDVRFSQSLNPFLETHGQVCGVAKASFN